MSSDSRKWIKRGVAHADARFTPLTDQLMSNPNDQNAIRELAKIFSLTGKHDYIDYWRNRGRPDRWFIPEAGWREARLMADEFKSLRAALAEAEAEQAKARHLQNRYDHEMRLRAKPRTPRPEQSYLMEQSAEQFFPRQQGFRIPAYLTHPATMAGLGCACSHLHLPAPRRINGASTTFGALPMFGQTLNDRVNTYRPSQRDAPSPRHRKQFLAWLKRFSPLIYAKLHSAGGPLAGLGQSTVTETQTPANASRWRDLIDSVRELGTVYIQGNIQKDILDAQLKRMELGLAPLETSQIAPTVHVGVDPAQVQAMLAAARQSASAGIQKWILPGVLGIGAYFLLQQRPKRGR